jgi:uncharacterized caspase-like protein
VASINIINGLRLPIEAKGEACGQGPVMQGLAFAVWLIALVVGIDSAHAEKRVALVIGNGAYKNVPKLENPAADADAMAMLLKSVGFDVVEGIDLRRDTMTVRLVDFSKRAKDADIAVFYYAGQGIAVEGTNYALPVDADIKSLADIKLGAAINIDDALDQTMSEAKVKLVFIDASRTNPYATSVQADGRRTSPAAGLAEMRSAEGSLIAFATGPGQTALDGPKGGHSPFTQALLDNITQPGVEIQQAMTMVRAQVHELTNGQQLAWGHSNLVGAVYLNPTAPAGGIRKN